MDGEMAMFCPDCGTQSPDWSKRCIACGRDLKPIRTEAQPARRRDSGALAKIIVSLILAVIVLIVGLVLVATGVSMLGTSQRTTALYTFTASYWDMNQLQAAILSVTAGVLLAIFSGVYLIVSVVVRNALRRSGP